MEFERNDSRICTVQNGYAIGQIPVMLDAVVLEYFPSETFVGAYLEFHLAERSTLDQSLPDEQTFVLHLFVPFHWVVLLGKGLILVPLDTIQHETTKLFLLLHSPFNHDHVDVLVQNHHTRHQELLDVGVNFEFFRRIL